MTDYRTTINESIVTHPLDGDDSRYFLGICQTSQGIVRAFMDISAETLAKYVDLLYRSDWRKTRIEGKLLIVPIETAEGIQCVAASDY